MNIALCFRCLVQEVEASEDGVRRHVTTALQRLVDTVRPFATQDTTTPQCHPTPAAAAAKQGDSPTQQQNQNTTKVEVKAEADT